MDKFVIRSMSTTDYRMAYRSGNTFVPEQKPIPYHVYLMPVEKRRGAYWNRHLLDAMAFDTIEDAHNEIARCELTSCDVVPYEHSNLPLYWEK